MTDAPISAELFAQRLARLCIQGGIWEMPTALRDKHILLKSMQLQLAGTTVFSEPEVNERLEDWLHDVAPSLDSDVANLRRMLVDFGYLVRETDGSRYRVGSDGVPFADEVNGLNPSAIMSHAKLQRAERKRTMAPEKD